MKPAAARYAWLRWQAAAGPWQGWSVCPVLLSPGVDAITARPAAHDVVTASHRLAAEIAPTLDGPPTLVQLDLEPVLGVHVAARLNELLLARPLLVIPRWPYDRATLPVDTLLHALLTGANRLSDLELPLLHVCLVLDADRQRPLPNRSPRDPNADNRYRLLPHELPTLAALRARGIRRLLKLTRA